MTLDPIARFIGDVARPYALISVATATAWAIFDAADAAIITAAGLILAAMYGARAIESGFQSRDAAKVQIAQTAPSAPQEVVVTNTAADPKRSAIMRAVQRKPTPP